MSGKENNTLTGKVKMTKSDKEGILVDWVIGVLMDKGAINIHTLYFGTKPLFYVEGYQWFKEAIRSSDKLHIDNTDRVLLTGEV